ncbi:MAG: hypothetical protein KF892_24985 [Rhizobacter sp.]|nr:hypothetical protein [Rhizobacter sp.]
MRAKIRDRVVDAHRTRGRVLVDYCLLPTEIHLIAELEHGDAPGDLARAIGSVVTRWVREAWPVRSPVLAGPFHAHQIQDEEDLRREIRLLAWRPVALGASRGPTFHRDGALRVALGRRPGDGFDSRPMLCLFGTTVVGARAALLSWVLQKPSEAERRAWEISRGLVLVRSGQEGQRLVARQVKSQAAAALIAAAGDQGVEGAIRLLATWVSARMGGAGAVDLHAGVDAAAVRGRALVARLVKEHRLCSSATVARHFGRTKATLSEQMLASRGRLADSEIVHTPISRILDDVSSLRSATGPSVVDQPVIDPP